MSSTASHVKIFFEIKSDDGTIEIESLWAVPETRGYRLDNIPFYARGFACGDIVRAARDADGQLLCSGVVLPSGHSTIRLWFAGPLEVQEVRNTLLSMGCTSELNHTRLVAVDIPPEVHYSAIQAYVEAQKSAGVFEYEEACLRGAHRS